MTPSPNPENTPDHPANSGGSRITIMPGVHVNSASIEIRFVRSSGPGGQNVNKRSTKAQLRVCIHELGLGKRVLARLIEQASGSINSSDELIIESDETRSQSRNKAACLDRLKELVLRASIEPKRRKATRPTKGSIRRRLDEKSKRADTKRLRKPPNAND